MSGTKVCNKCGKKNLGWDYDFNKKTKKWKLENHKTLEGKWCNKPKEEKRFYMGKKEDYVKCELCLGNSGHCYVDGFFDRHPEIAGSYLSEHMAQWHPNGEILDDVDFMSLSDGDKEKQRKLMGLPPKPKKIA